MAALMRVTCLMLLVSMAYSWSIPSSHLDDWSNGNSTTFSIFDEMNRMMAAMHERFQRLFDSSPAPSTDMDDRKELDALQPNCTTTTSSSATGTSSQQNRRRKLRPTQTMTCVKELVVNGKKQMYKETNVTDDTGALISRSKIYQTIAINTNNGTLPIDMNNDRDVISY